MRQTIKGLVAAFAVMTAGSAPAMACGLGGCCGAVDPCAGSYAAPAYSYAPTYSYSYSAYTGCGACGTGGWGYERLAEPTTQYYYVNQGPTYSGPGAFAPAPAYQEAAIPAYTGYRYGYHHYRSYHHRWHYGYQFAPRHYGYYPHHYAYRHWGHEGYYYGHPLVRRYY
jgi:hypothetical protein